MGGAIDVGSNSLRLLVVDENHNLIKQEVVETRLGEGFREGSITSGAMDRTIEAIEEWQQDLTALGCDSLAIFATSAVRDAANKEEFCRLVRNRTGLDLKVLSGEEEAWYSFSGAVGGFDFPREECLLIDIGGGSTEIALYQDGDVLCFSVPIGAVRWKVMAYSRSDVKKILSRKTKSLDLSKISKFIAVGGTATTAGAILARASVYRRETIHGRTIARDKIIQLERELEAMTIDQRKEVVGLAEPRADIIVYGLSILEILCELISIEKVIVSDWGILDGYLEANKPKR